MNIQMNITSMHSPRWMKRYYTAFESSPGDMETTTIMDQMSPLSVSAKYVEAAKRKGGYPTRMMLSRMHRNGWPSDTAIMKVWAFIAISCNYYHRGSSAPQDHEVLI